MKVIFEGMVEFYDLKMETNERRGTGSRKTEKEKKMFYEPCHRKFHEYFNDKVRVPVPGKKVFK